MILYSKSKLIGLLPFLDSDGIMYAKGRLRKADMEYQTTHPIILHSQHWAVRLFLETMHKTWHQEGVEGLRSVVQKQFWILGLRNALRSVKHDCVQYKKLARTLNSRISDLAATCPFSICRVDYFGPYQVKHFRKRVKKWICLFTCFNIRAICLESVSSLNTQSCLDAVQRFVPRQGCQKTIL